MKQTHPIPLDLEAMRAYKAHQMPISFAPDSQFAFASLYAFSSLMETVTVDWRTELVRDWNTLIRFIDRRMHLKNDARRNQQSSDRERELLISKLESDLAHYKKKASRKETATVPNLGGLEDVMQETKNRILDFERRDQSNWSFSRPMMAAILGGLVLTVGMTFWGLTQSESSNQIAIDLARTNAIVKDMMERQSLQIQYLEREQDKTRELVVDSTERVRSELRDFSSPFDKALDQMNDMIGVVQQRSIDQKSTKQ